LSLPFSLYISLSLPLTLPLHLSLSVRLNLSHSFALLHSLPVKHMLARSLSFFLSFFLSLIRSSPRACSLPIGEYAVACAALCVYMYVCVCLLSETVLCFEFGDLGP